MSKWNSSICSKLNCRRSERTVCALILCNSLSKILLNYEIKITTWSTLTNTAQRSVYGMKWNRRKLTAVWKVCMCKFCNSDERQALRKCSYDTWQEIHILSPIMWHRCYEITALRHDSFPKCSTRIHGRITRNTPGMKLEWERSNPNWRLNN